MLIAWTELPDKTGKTMTAHTGEYEQLIARVRGIGMFPSKDKCPWIKLATFGDQRTSAGSLRTNENLNAIYGIEADYDGEMVTMVDAIATLERYGIRAMVYPSPSCTALKPRWRVLCPLAKQHAPSARAALVARLNGALDGVLAGESFTLSQGYFFGATPTNDYQVLLTFDDAEEGVCIDDLDELDEIAIGKATVKEKPKTDGESPKTKAERSAQPEYATQDERHAALVKAILSGDVYHETLRDLAASLVATGMNAGAVVNHLRGLMDASEGARDDRWSDRRASIPTLVNSATAKFGPTSTDDFDDLLKAASEQFDGAKAQDADSGQADAPETDTGEPPKSEQPTDGAEGTAKPEPHYRLLTAADLNALPPLRWRIRDVLPETGLGMILGMSTAGKTFVALDMAAHVSLGMAWHGFKTYAAPVVYVGLEGEQGIQRRINAWKQHYELALPDTFRFVLQPFNMLQLTNVADLAAAVLDAGGKGGVIIVDTLNRATPGADENSSVDMGNTIAAAKKLQAATSGMVMLVHHKGKSDAAGARGHSSLYGALDAAIAVNNQGGSRSWSTDPAKGGKSKDGEAVTKGFDLESVPLGVDEDLSPINSAVVVPCGASLHQLKPLTQAQKCAMDAYDTAAREHGTLDAEDNFAGLHVEAWRTEFYRTTTADNTHAKKTAFQRARNDLVKLGQVSVVNDVYRLEGMMAFMENTFAEALRQKGDYEDLV